MTDSSICIIGGTGFVGRQLAHRLTRDGYNVRIPTRRRDRHRDLLVNPRIRLIETDVHDAAALLAVFEGCSAVVNLVGILNERGNTGSGFKSAHVELPRSIVAAMQTTGVRRLLHMSALNAYPREEHSRYLRSKGQGEDLVHAASAQGLQVTSFRPSVIFGPGDSFFNRFATLLKVTPVMFPLACPDSVFAPVFVGDVVEAMARSLSDPNSHGKHYDLCGPERYTLAELVDYTARQIGVTRHIWKLGPTLSWWQARALEFVPGKPFSRDNYWSLQKESQCQKNALIELGITPTAIGTVVPGYLNQQHARGRYAAFRRHARRST